MNPGGFSICFDSKSLFASAFSLVIPLALLLLRFKCSSCSGESTLTQKSHTVVIAPNSRAHKGDKGGGSHHRKGISSY